MNKIQDKLYLGNIKAASDLKSLKAAGITHVLQVASGIKPFFPNDLTYKVINVLDSSNQSLLRHFPAAIQFIKDGMSRGGAVLVHCYAGVSRSATCVIAFLMQERDLSFEDAFSFASKQRPVIFPNMGFQRQLTEFERLLHVKRQFSVPKQFGKGQGRSVQPRELQQTKQGGTWQFNSINAKGSGGGGGNDDRIMKQVQAVLSRKGNGKPLQPNVKAYQDHSMAVQDVYDPKEDPFEYNRLAHFERSASFGFQEDKLGRLNEINHEQVQQVLRGDKFLKFRRTNSNFHRSNQINKTSAQQGNGYPKINGAAGANQSRQQINKSMQKTSWNMGSKKDGNNQQQPLNAQFQFAHGLQKTPHAHAVRGGPTPLPKAEDSNSYQSVNTEERLQRLSMSKDRQNRVQKTQEYANESMDEPSSPLIHRLDSQNSFRNNKQT